MNPTRTTGPSSLLADSAWQAFASGQVKAQAMRQEDTLRLVYDFAGGGGFAVARQETARDLPEEFAIHLRLRATGPANDVELKLVDETGRNVWRHTLRAASLTGEWQDIVLPDYQFEFAWGPAGGGSIRRLSAVELAVVAGAGGLGEMAVSMLEIADNTLQTPPLVTCSRGSDTITVSSKGLECWAPSPEDAAPWLEVAFPAERMLGGLILEWEANAPEHGLSVHASDLSGKFTALWRAERMGGPRSYLRWPGREITALRVALKSPAVLRSLSWQPFSFSSSPEAFWHAVAAREPRGYFPRWLDRIQSLWTPVGTPEGQPGALMNEDGMVEPLPGSFSIEPFVSVNGRLFTRADCSPQQSLTEDWMPLPQVTWSHAAWSLRILSSAAAPGSVSAEMILTNLSGSPVQAVLYAAIRPFQVTPPWQKFGALGGISPVHSIVLTDGVIRVNDSVTLTAEGEPEFGAMTAAEGILPAILAAGRIPENAAAEDESGEVSGVMAWRFTLPPGGTRRVVWHCGEAALSLEHSANRWREKLAANRLSASEGGMEVVHSALTAAAHVLLTRCGPALQPGPRRYTRSWIRDGTVMAAALLRMGCEREVREFISWYAPHQRADGFVPCLVDATGPDWLVEHDSHGQFLSLITDHFRLVRDAAFTSALWQRVELAADYMARTMEPDGLMPVSVSHEGYLSQPVHSFWDDFWALRGLLDAAWLADALGHAATAELMRSTAERVSRGLRQAIAATRQEHALAWIPASVEWADFDPVASAGAVIARDNLEELDHAALHRTFDQFMSDWRRKRSGDLEWSNYTAYEVRIIGALVRLGRRDEALELLHFLIRDQRPRAWQQWPEITWRDPLWPGHIGDVPHSWIAAEFLLAVHSLFAWESVDRAELILAAGLDAAWLSGDGVRVNALPVSTGELSYTLRQLADDALEMHIPATLQVPTGGLRVRPPTAAPIRMVHVNGAAHADFSADEIRLHVLPATLLIFHLTSSDD